VDGTGLRSCPNMGFGISGVDTSYSATGQLIGNVGLREIGYEDGRWMELSQNRVL
jgi:hypothetical protein